MYASLDPFHHFIVHACVAAEVQAAQGLRSPEQGCNILDGRPDEATILQVQMYQEDIILDEVFEARDDFQVKASQFNLRFSIYNLLSCQTGPKVKYYLAETL